MRPHQTNILLPALSLFLHKTLFAEVFGVNKVMSSTPAPAARPGNHIIPQARGELYDYYELRKSWRAPAPQILSLSLSSTTGSEGPDSRWHLKQLRSSYKTPCSFFIPHDLFYGTGSHSCQLKAQGPQLLCCSTPQLTTLHALKKLKKLTHPIMLLGCPNTLWVAAGYGKSGAKKQRGALGKGLPFLGEEFFTWIL
jgi:hypothetical protein